MYIISLKIVNNLKKKMPGKANPCLKGIDFFFSKGIDFFFPPKGLIFNDGISGFVLHGNKHELRRNRK